MADFSFLHIPSKLTGWLTACIPLQFPRKFSGHFGRRLDVEELVHDAERKKMETVIFALNASHTYGQQESVVAEPGEFQLSAEKLRGKQTEPVVESTGGIRAANRLISFDYGLEKA